MASARDTNVHHTRQSRRGSNPRQDRYQRLQMYGVRPMQMYGVRPILYTSHFFVRLLQPPILYCTASAPCAAVTASEAAKSAIVRATLEQAMIDNGALGSPCREDPRTHFRSNRTPSRCPVKTIR